MRSKHDQHQHPYPPQPSDFYPPATPHRVPSGGFIDAQGFYTPMVEAGTPYRPAGLDRALSMPVLGEERERERDVGGRSSRKKTVFS
jgi:hypothetical protein